MNNYPTHCFLDVGPTNERPRLKKLSRSVVFFLRGSTTLPVYLGGTHNRSAENNRGSTILYLI